MNKTALIFTLCPLLQVALVAQNNDGPKPRKPILPPTLQLTPKKYLPEELADKCSRQYLTPKGELGQVDSDFFISLGGGDKNEIRQPGPKSWTGLEKSRKQIVFIYKRAIYEADKLPQDFDLYEATLISFEGEIVRILWFKNFSGGIYLRTTPEKTIGRPKPDQ